MSDEIEKTTRVSQVPRMTKGNIRSNNIRGGGVTIKLRGSLGEESRENLTAVVSFVRSKRGTR